MPTLESIMHTWQIGDVKITKIVELESVGGSRFILPDATPEAVLKHDWLSPHFINDEGKLIMSVHALIVETPTKTIIVDTCLGNDKKRNIPAWNNLQLPFLEDRGDFLQWAFFLQYLLDFLLCLLLRLCFLQAFVHAAQDCSACLRAALSILDHATRGLALYL